MTHYTIDIVSDTVCPWCYVGKNRLDLAIQQHRASHPADTFATRWFPFYLNPDAPRSVDKQAYYERKFGRERTAVMQAHLARVGRQVGIDFAFAGKTGNTRDSHRLIQLAQTMARGPEDEKKEEKKEGEDPQTRIVEALFHAYFEANEDITDRDVLVRCAVQAGMDQADARAWIDSDRGGAEVDAEVALANEKAISGVPNFTINSRFEIHGAEEPAAFLQVFGAIKEAGDDLNGINGIAGSKRGGNIC